MTPSVSPDFQDPVAPAVFDQQRKRRRVLIGAAIIVLIGVAVVAAKPVFLAAKGVRARQLAHKAERLLAEDRGREAVEVARAALLLRPEDPVVIRTIAHLQSRSGNPTGAIAFWEQLGTSATPDDRRDHAEDLLRTGSIAPARRILEDLLRDQPASGANLQLAARVFLALDQYAEALRLAEQALSVEPANRDFQLLVVRLQSQSNALDVRKAGVTKLVELARAKDQAGLAALTLLAQRADLQPADSSDLVSLLKSHPLAKEEHRLLACDWQLRLEPADKHRVFDQLVEEKRTASPATRRLIAVWLNNHGQYQRVLDLLPSEESASRKDLFLVHLDALAGLRRWAEIKALLARKEAPLETAYKEVFLARSEAELGDANAAESHWRRARQAAGTSGEQMLFIATYAERAGKTEQAELVYRSLSTNSTTSRPAYEGLLRLATRSKDTNAELKVLTAMLERWPADVAVKSDCAYLNLLQYRELPRSRELARQLVASAPASLPHRTVLALAELRFGDPLAALAVYDNLRIDWRFATPSGIAIRIASLSGAGRLEEASDLAKRLASERLRAEERDLIYVATGVRFPNDG